MSSARNRHRSVVNEEMEENNNKQIHALGSKVFEMKNIAIDIQKELEKQNKQLDDLSTPMSRLGDMFKKTMSAMGKMTQGGGSCYMCQLILFVFVFFLLLKYLIMG
ncbi:hypothetical protein AAMO2058_001063000 [Amorphochlora amoebiformis]